MDIQELKNTVNTGVTDSTFKLNLTSLKTSSIDLVSKAYIANDQLQLTIAAGAINETASSITVTGSAIDAPFENFTIAAKFTIDSSANPVIELTANASPEWKLINLISGLKGKLAENIAFDMTTAPSFTVVSDQTNPKTPSLIFCATIDLVTTNQELSQVLGKDSLEVNGDIEFESNGADIKTFLLNGPEISGVDLVVASNVTLGSGIGINLYTDHSNNTVAAIPFIKLTANIPFSAQGHEHKLPVAVQITNFDTPLKFSADINSAIDAGIDEITALAGGVGLQKYLPTSGFQIEKLIKVSGFFFNYDLKAKKLSLINITINSTAPWELLNLTSPKIKITATNVAFSLIVTDPEKGKATATGSADFILGTSATISVAANYPNWAISAYLKEGELKISELANNFLGTTAELPEINISDLELDISSGNYTVNSTTQLGWNLLEKPTTIDLENVELAIDHNGTDTTGNVNANLQIGGVDFSMYADYNKGWNFQGTAATQTPISVNDFVNALLSDLGLPKVSDSAPKVNLSNLSATYETQTKAFGFAGDSTAKFNFPFFDKQTSLDLTLKFDSTIDSATSKRTYSAIFTSSLLIGHAKFMLKLQAMEDANSITGSWQSTDGTTIGFSDIASFLGIDVGGIDIPSGLDLALNAVEFIMDISTKQFTLAANSKNYGTAFFTAGYDSNNALGFVFGVNFNHTEKFSDLPEIGKYLSNADFIELQSASVIISKGNFKAYTIPTLPTQTGTPAPPVAFGSVLDLSTGISLACAVNMDQTGADNVVIKNLNSIVKKSTLILQLSYTSTTVSIKSILDGSVKIPTGKTALTIKNPSIEINITPEVFVKLSADFDFTIDKTDMDAKIAMAFAPTQASVSASLTVPGGSLPPPPGVKGLHMNEIGLMMGVFFEPPSILFGIDGKFKIGKEQAKDDQFSFVLQIIGEVVNPLYLSFYLDEIDMGTLVTLFTDQQPSGDLLATLNQVSAKEVSFYWAEANVVLPDNTTALAGFGFGGELDIFGFHMFAEAEVKQSSGISGKAQTDPINLGSVLQIEGDGKEIVRKVDAGGKTASNKLSLKDSKTTKQVIVKAGGPHLEISTSSSPFLSANWDISLFEKIKESTEISVGLKGVTFDLSYSIAKVSSFVLKNTLKDWTDYKGSATFKLGVDETINLPKVVVDLGSIHLDVSVSAGFFTHLSTSTESIGLKDMSFNFEGIGFTIPDITLSTSLKSLSDLPGEILNKLENDAKEIFSQLFTDPLIYAKFVKDAVIKIEGDLAKILKESFNQSIDEVAKTLKAAGYAAKDVAKSLKAAFNVGAKAIGIAMSGAGYAADAVVESLYAIGATANEIGDYLNSLGLPIDKLKDIIKDAAGVPADILKSIGDIIHIY